MSSCFHYFFVGLVICVVWLHEPGAQLQSGQHLLSKRVIVRVIKSCKDGL